MQCIPVTNVTVQRRKPTGACKSFHQIPASLTLQIVKSQCRHDSKNANSPDCKILVFAAFLSKSDHEVVRLQSGISGCAMPDFVVTISKIETKDNSLACKLSCQEYP